MSASLDRAMVLLQQSRPELAEKELRGLLAENPNDPFAHAFLGLCLQELNRLPEATEEAQEAIRIAPDLPLGHLVMGQILLLRNRVKEAEVACEEAIRLDPGNANAWALMANIRLQRRDWAEALDAAERGLEIDPENVQCNNLRAMALVNLGRRDEAGQTIDAALSRDPDNAVTHANRGWTLLNESDPGQALHHFREALRLDPELDWARAGIVEALKARNPIYRVMLGYFLWMAKKSRGIQVIVILTLIFGRRIISSIGQRYPEWAPVTTALLIGLFAFVVLSWISVPLFNLLLRLDRFGRHALSREQVIGSNWLGGALVAMVVCALASFPLNEPRLLMAAIQLFLLLLPLAGTLQSSPGWPRRAMALLTLGLFVIGPGTNIASIALAIPGEIISSMEDYFLIGVIASTWIGVVIGQVTPRR